MRTAAFISLEQIAERLAELLSEADVLDKNRIDHFLSKIEEILDDPSLKIMTNLAISMFGFFADSCANFSHNPSKIDQLLTKISTNFDLNIKSVLNSNEGNRAIKNVLGKQKDYIALLQAYSKVIRWRGTNGLNEVSP